MRILQLSTHTTLIPQHGGKLRSHHVARVLEHEGFELQRLAFCHRVGDDVDDPREPIIDIRAMPFWENGEFDAYGPCRFRLSDYLGTPAALRVPSILAEFDERVRAARPDVILLEHPWTWPLLARLDEVRSGAVRVVYNSQNVEIALKRRVMEDENMWAPPGVLEGIEALERDLVAHATGVSACTRVDADAYVDWGARRVVVAPNGGVRRERGHLLDIVRWPIEPAHSYALAVGSDHPPNVSGFMDLVLPSLPLLRPFQRVVVAGGACRGIGQALEAKGLTRMAEGRLILLGPVDEFCLDCTIANAHVLLLPIQYGGGSNVKTAEALLSRRLTVATATAMRGFHGFSDVPGMTVAEADGDFGRAMLAALDRPFQAESPDHPLLASLLWEHTIAPLAAMMRQIEKEISASRRPAKSLPDTAQRAGQEA
jgi:Glycosyl transferase 4-like domain/Glycosyl transferases group 1